ncbi:DNA-binding domain-containing protein [uncultured Tenacibaculum sp.]|uniref:HU family DNA-binding protein n=1 Tax=uncultured Tenacibaculum sp. TaxID=174713 RepID=UPI00262476AE|nr:DNA-binding domain-containing protein [uncultured Tenacibaculum sp.]
MKYYLTKNHLNEEDNYIARVLATRSVSQAALIKKMLEKRSAVGKTDIVAVLNSFYETIIQCIKDGDTVNLPLFNISYSITGVFDNDEEIFSEKKHKLHLKLKTGKLIKNVLHEVPINKVAAPNTYTQITQVIDIGSGTSNQQITSEGLFELLGSRLKIAGSHPSVGLYFIGEDQTEIKVTRFSRNTFKNIIAQAPHLLPGRYHIRIKSQFTSNPQAFLKGVRISDTSFKLVVV